uniref:Uncharacterized protein n=1 Tax=Arundo donax TaxID=35708 RepID=A0A0A9B962_ARUDO
MGSKSFFHTSNIDFLPLLPSAPRVVLAVLGVLAEG